MNSRETEAADRFRSYGIRVEPCTTTFYLDNEIRYTPDLYLPDLNIYVEVIGSRQAFGYNQKKYTEVLNSGAANFLLTTHDGKPLYPTKFHKPTSCNVVGCRLPAESVSIGPYDRLCPKHQRRLAQFGILEERRGGWRVLRPKVHCHYPGCGKYARPSGLCSTHHATAIRCGAIATTFGTCTSHNCSRPATSSGGLCHTHYCQMRIHGRTGNLRSERADRRRNTELLKSILSASPFQG